MPFPEAASFTAPRPAARPDGAGGTGGSPHSLRLPQRQRRRAGDHPAPAGDAGRGAGPPPRAEAARARLPREGVTVWLRGGDYHLHKTFTLTAEDDTSPAPVTYRAYRTRRCGWTAGRTVTGWTAVTDPAILARLDPAARGHVLQADLKAQGITDFGELTPRGFGRPGTPAALELFFNDAPMTLARWPNAGPVGGHRRRRRPDQGGGPFHLRAATGPPAGPTPTTPGCMATGPSTGPTPTRRFGARHREASDRRPAP